MKRLIVIFFIVLGASNSLHSQDFILFTKFTNDSIARETKQKFDSYKKAETRLNFKIDSLKSSGYLFLSEKRKVEKNNLFSAITLNQKIDSLSIHINENDFKLFPKNLSVVSGKIQIPYSEIDNTLNFVVQQLKNSGLAFGKASLSNIRMNEESMQADLVIDTGVMRTIDKINIKGYSLLSETYITRYSNLKVGSKFKESDIQKKTEQLDNIVFIKVKKPTEVLFKKDSTELFLYLDKLNSNSFDGFLGFGSDEENNFQLNGYLNMVLLNNLDFGERLSINYKNNGFGLQIFEGDLKLPFVLKSPISIEAGLRLFRRDSLFSNNSQNIDLNYQINERLSLQGGIDFTNSTNLQLEELVSYQEIVDYKSTFYGVGFKFIKLGSRQGFNEDTFVNINTYLGRRESQINADQYKLSIEGQHQVTIDYRNKIYMHLNSQFLISDTYYNNELFRFGGVNSIRGFAENSLIANRFAVLRSEYRYLLDDNLFVNSVLDIGNYNDKISRIDENILGYGIGLGLRSKAGIFRLILANAISDSQNSDLSSSKIHIGFISFF
ncbi:BamA/TamA family outer membrane protein [Psychroflexus sp. CAK8W]|uniref:BamA/TamA family outer membrane protein n=1 Tax=Psychroflexus longus TaxID=2873596 RepID=A0ABS7XEW2_9FLAO|nr:ShlB/FhaC/HecB family hemolysin secretion/activation protein [Psychroflexus longus]MBZ9777491.1 BamA/TamA family outer membrane protein [Psychroflexus longus]